MSRNLHRRVDALEAGSPVSLTARAEADFWRAVRKASGNFGPYDSELTVAERVARFTPLEHLAWDLKFTGEADLEAVLPLYGINCAADLSATEMQKWLGWVLLMNWIPGD